VIRTLSLTGACCLGAMLLAACGGGSNDDDSGVKISAVRPTTSAHALGDFAVLGTPQAVAATPGAAVVDPTPAPAPRPADTPAASSSLPASSPVPAPANAATPVTTFTQQLSGTPVAGTGGCGPVAGGSPQIVTGAPPPGGPAPSGGSGGGPQVFTVGGDPMAGLASFLGISTAQLQSELSQKGATQASVAARHGKSRDQLKAFVAEQNRKMMAEAIAAGRMTQAQATQLQSQFAADVDKMIDGSGCGGAPITFAPGQ
jgi:hypothetical protein